MKKLLIMASLFWPQKNSGGPPISIMNLVKSIKDEFDIYIISKNHELNSAEPLEGIHEGWNEFDFGHAYYVNKGEHTYKNIYSLIQHVAPDTIYQNSFFSFDDLLPVLMYKKHNSKTKVIVAPRGEFYPERLNKGKVKKVLFSKLIRYSGLLKGVYFQGTGEDECKQEIELLRLKKEQTINIQNLSIVDVKNSQIAKNPGELKLCFIARIHSTKNLLSAIQWLEGQSGNITYDIYGSIEDEDYWKQCQAAIEQLTSNITVNCKGSISHDMVADTIAKYHAYYMPTYGENFGHSIVEAMHVGRPVIISDQTPWTEVNACGGYAFSLAEENKFKNAINELVYMECDEYEKHCKSIKAYIKSTMKIDEIIEQYIGAFGG